MLAEGGRGEGKVLIAVLGEALGQHLAGVCGGCHRASGAQYIFSATLFLWGSNLGALIG